MLFRSALQSNTAKLSSVQILEPTQCVGRSTADSLQSGLYYGQLGAIKEITTRIQSEYFAEKSARVIATGGFSRLLEKAKLFDTVDPDLVLKGLCYAYEANK